MSTPFKINYPGKRTISGTHSDRSTGSLKELIFIKSIHEHQTIGNEGARLFFCQITTSDQPIKENIVGNHAKVPFSVTSIIPWQKAQNRTANTRYLCLCTLTLKSVKKSSGSEIFSMREKDVVKNLSSKKMLCFDYFLLTVPNNSYRFWLDLLHKWSF